MSIIIKRNYLGSLLRDTHDTREYYYKKDLRKQSFKWLLANIQANLAQFGASWRRKFSELEKKWTRSSDNSNWSFVTLIGSFYNARRLLCAFDFIITHTNIYLRSLPNSYECKTEKSRAEKEKAAIRQPKAKSRKRRALFSRRISSHPLTFISFHERARKNS